MDSKNLTLSIIIPVYNTSKYLVRCLDSVVFATESIQDKTEVLIINDGSTDDSGIIIMQYCKQYSYFIQFEKDNGGLSDVKNFGLSHAKGEYVIFLDSDDYVDSKMYVTMLDKAKRNQADLVVCDIELVYDDKRRNQCRPCTADLRDGIFNQVIDVTIMPASCNKIVKKELYNKLTFPVGKNNEDVAVTPIILARAVKIEIVHEPFYKYYQRDGSIQNSKFDESRFVILETAKMCIDRLKDITPEKSERIKDSLYVNQILALPMNPIRHEKFKSCYTLLKKYMLLAEQFFPDIWENYEVNELSVKNTYYTRIVWKFSLFLLRKKQYFFLSLLWIPCNYLEMILKYFKGVK